jgi:hypothetical protein
MALQQFHTVDMLHYDKKEKEVQSPVPLLTSDFNVFRESCEQIMTQADHNQSSKYAMSAAHTSLVSTTTDDWQTISQEK